MNKTKISLRSLKVKASGLPQSVANLILSEPDEMDSDEFFAKSSVWFKALQSESVGEKR